MKETPESKTMKKSRFPILIFLILISLLCVSGCGNNGNSTESTQPTESTTVLAVGNYEITQNEIDYFKSRLRVDVVNYYSSEYGVTDFSDFWDKEFDGQTPTEYLEKKAKSEAIKAKAELSLMKEYEIYDDISFEGLKAKAESFNKEHENSSGTVGITSIDISSFYTYYISNGRLEIINRISEDDPATQEEIDAFREENGLGSDVSDNYIKSKLAENKYNDEMLPERISQLTK